MKHKQLTDLRARSISRVVRAMELVTADVQDLSILDLQRGFEAMDSRSIKALEITIAMIGIAVERSAAAKVDS